MQVVAVIDAARRYRIRIGTQQGRHAGIQERRQHVARRQHEGLARAIRCLAMQLRLAALVLEGQRGDRQVLRILGEIGHVVPVRVARDQGRTADAGAAAQAGQGGARVVARVVQANIQGQRGQLPGQRQAIFRAVHLRRRQAFLVGAERNARPVAHRRLPRHYQVAAFGQVVVRSRARSTTGCRTGRARSAGGWSASRPRHRRRASTQAGPIASAPAPATPGEPRRPCAGPAHPLG